jgi:hypothetical protein
MRVPEPGETLGRYRLDRVVGRGGMAVVFAATDLRLDRTVALKVITGAYAQSPEFRRRFHAEAAALARLDSPYVTQIHDHDEVDDVLFIVTQYVDGTDLWSLLRRGGALPVTDGLRLVAQLCRGLGEAHRRGLVHRDVKPSNVLVRDAGTPEMHAYLCDFGVARGERPDADAPETAPGVITGTWAYLAPECVQGAPATPASDLYALGCVLWACLTGREPYAGTDVEAAMAHVQAPVPQLAGSDDLTDRINTVLARVLAKDPAERHPDAATLRHDLETVAADAPATPLPAATTVPRPTSVRGASPAPATRPPAPHRGRLALLVAGVVAVCLVVVGATWAVFSGDDDGAGSDAPAVPGVAGDLDGDGHGDLQVLQTRSGTAEFSPVALWQVPSNGRAFTSPERGTLGAGRPDRGDVDGDGATDQLWLDKVSVDDGIGVEVTPADGEAWSQEIDLDPALFGLVPDTAVGDVTGDGRDDLVLLGRPSDGVGGVHVAPSTGDGFGPVEQWWTVPADVDSSAVFTADADGDGTSEVLFVFLDDDSRDRLQVLTAGDDGFTAGEARRVGEASVSLYLSVWLIGDVDGDGADELVIPASICRDVHVHDLDEGVLAAPTSWWERDLDEEQARACFDRYYGGYWTLSDVDGDGDADLVELRPTAPAEQRYDIRAYLAEGDRFAAPAPWGSLDCGAQCDDTFSLQ